MATLSFRADLKLADRTLAAIEAGVAAQAGDGVRPHLGASLLGDECERKLWYAFRWAKQAAHEPRVLRLFARGQREERVFIDLLRQAGITVVDVDPNSGQQFTFSTLGGHVGGSMDAACQGLPESRAWHVVEMKTHAKKSFDDLIKKGVEQSKPLHYAQMQAYMGWTGMTRALYMAVCKDDDRLHLERIDADPVYFERLMTKAERIVAAVEPPERLSDDPAWFQCKWCEYAELCHGTAVPLPTCRSCCHSTPELDGNARWHCLRHKSDVSVAEQKEGCQAHLFIPALLKNFASVEDSSESENWIEYQHRETGKPFRNGLYGECFQSLEIHSASDKRALTEEAVKEIRREFAARVVA